VKYNFILDILQARIAGTGMNLSVKKTSVVGYNNRHIRGIKKLVDEMIKYFYAEITSELPIKEDKFDSEQLKPIIYKLGDKFHIPSNYIQKEIEATLSGQQMIRGITEEMTSAFIINAFFNAFDTYREDFASNSISIIQNMFVRRLNRNLPNFKQSNFGFLFRAREYSKSFSDVVYNGGFNGTVKRISNALLDEYHSLKKSPDASSNTEVDLEFNTESDSKFKEMSESLKSKNKEKIIEAIMKIQSERIIEMKKELEQLLQHPNDQIQNLALDAIMSFEDDLIAE
jgi:hypothetical protein